MSYAAAHRVGPLRLRVVISDPSAPVLYVPAFDPDAYHGAFASVPR